MALLNATQLRREVTQSGTWGKVSTSSGSYAITTSEAGLDNIALCKVPANAKIVGISYSLPDTGTAVWDFGVLGVFDNTDVNETLMLTDVGDAATNAATFFSAPVSTGTDESGYYVIATPSVAPTIAVTLSVTVFYEYEGYEA